MSDKKELNKEQLGKVSGGETPEQPQYVCRKCGAIIDINTADKKVVNLSDDTSASTQFGYWCSTCNDYVAVVPVDGLRIDACLKDKTNYVPFGL